MNPPDWLARLPKTRADALHCFYEAMKRQEGMSLPWKWNYVGGRLVGAAHDELGVQMWLHFCRWRDSRG